MKVGILITSISNFGKIGFYNAQEVGLAKALSHEFSQVIVYKLVPITHVKKTEYIEGYPDVLIHFLPAKNTGINGIFDPIMLDSSLDALIHFSDTQLTVPKIYKWCKKNDIYYIPYIGVVESHSTNKIKQFITNIMFRRNLDVYKKCICCVKTPQVQSKIKKRGINNAVITPVGLDFDLLKKDYKSYDVTKLKEKYGYCTDDKIILFIGRLIDEKRPIKMLDIFTEINKKDNAYKLLIIGTGLLKKAVEEKINENGINKSVHILDSIANSEIWELYCISDALVNLNEQEIFGMAILEAMYYGCKVVAWNAPGPNFIIKNGLNGFLANSDSEIIKYIEDSRIFKETAPKYIEEKFNWNITAKQIAAIIKKLVAL